MSINQFELELDAESKVCLAQVPKFLRDVATEVVGELIAITPVSSGHAKANWVVGLNYAPSGEIVGVDPSPIGVIVGPTFAAAKSVLAGVDSLTKTIYVVNNVDYISRIIEDGYSNQTPSGEFSAVLQRIEAKYS